MEIGQSSAQRWLDVGPERIGGWLESFAARHGGASYQPGPDVVRVLAAGGAGAEGAGYRRARAVVGVLPAAGAAAESPPPFPPLAAGSAGTGAELAAHAL